MQILSLNTQILTRKKWGDLLRNPVVFAPKHGRFGQPDNRWGDLLRNPVELTPFFTLFGGTSAEMTGFLAVF